MSGSRTRTQEGPEEGTEDGTEAPRRRRWPLIALALAAFLVVAVAGAPAGLLARLVHGQTDQVRLLAPSGGVWDGSADLVVEGRDLGRLHWVLTPASLLQARAGAAVTLSHPDHRARARLALSLDGTLHVDDLDVTVDEAGLDALLRPYAIEPSGSVAIGPGRLRARDGRLVDADVEAHWSGGAVRYRLGGQTFFADLPPLEARLAPREGIPTLELVDPTGAPLLDARLRADGWVDLRMRYRMAALAGFPWPDPPAPDVIVLELSEQVL